MKIGIDLHGVIESFPEVFKPLMILARKRGCEIVVITGPPIDQANEELNNAGYAVDVHFDSVISVVDWLKKRGAEMTKDDNGNWWTTDVLWWQSKSLICVRENIDVMIDDSPEYGEYFEFADTKFVLIDKPAGS